MKKIITPVGVSMFENYIKSKDNASFRKAYDYFKDKDKEELGRNPSRVELIKSALEKWFDGENENASAEVKSLIKLKEKLEDTFEVHLIASDTALGYLAAEILKEKLPDYKKLEISQNEIKLHHIKDLQVWDAEKFKDGLVNLIQEISKIADEYWGDVILNMTGGYKATIPYLTILSQVNRCPIYYIFEDTDALMEIPYIPLDIKWSMFEKHKDFFRRLEKEQISEIPPDTIQEEREEILSLLESAGNLYSLNPLGIILWEKFKRNYELFYISELVKEYIRKNEYKKIAEKSFMELKRRLKENPKHPDLHHSLKGFNPPKGFYTFKHKENNLQVRILYKAERFETRYGGEDFDICIGLIAIGKDVHNAESEYVEWFRKNSPKVANLDKYELYEIKKEG